MTELHLHLDGSIRPATAYECARKLCLIDDSESLDQFRQRMIAPQSCGSLNAYLERFDIPLILVKDRDILRRVTYELVCDLADEGITRAELRFAPNSSVSEQMTQKDACEVVLEGVEEGMRMRPSIDIGIILCCMRGLPEALNLETVRLAAEFKGTRIRAVDLAGAEAIFPSDDYESVFAYANQLNVPFTFHAGEAAGPESVRAALKFGAKRIGHGVRSVEDPELVKELARRGTTLEVCVTSNVQTGICSSAAAHPIRTLFDAGVRVTLSSDNRTVSDTTLRNEWETVKTQLRFTDDELALMDSYACEALFS